MSLLHPRRPHSDRRHRICPRSSLPLSSIRHRNCPRTNPGRQLDHDPLRQCIPANDPSLHRRFAIAYDSWMLCVVLPPSSATHCVQCPANPAIQRLIFARSSSLDESRIEFKRPHRSLNSECVRGVIWSIIGQISGVTFGGPMRDCRS
jgi:hypothetical protein